MKTLIFSSLFSLALFAQQPQQTAAPLTDQRIIELVRAGITGDELKRLIATAPSVSFILTPAMMQTMMQAGVTEDTIKAMAARESNGPTAPGQPSGVSTTGQPAQVKRTGANASQPSLQGNVFFGYAYLNIDTNDLTQRQNANGWEAAVALGNKWIAGEADFGAYYKSYVVPSGVVPDTIGAVNVAVHDYSFAGGPRVNLGPTFFHVLLGADRLTGSALGFSASQTGFLTAFGGGVQSRAFAGHWAARASADYALSHHNIFGGPSFTQDNFRVSGGIVYLFNTRTFNSRID